MTYEKAFIGGGITTLAAALQALETGTKPEDMVLYIQGGDPRKMAPGVDDLQSSSGNGRPLRFASPWETDHYAAVGPTYLEGAAAFLVPYTDGGYLGKGSFGAFSKATQRKLLQYIHSSQSSAEDLAKLVTEMFNMQGMRVWQDMIKKHQWLIEGADYKEEMIRTYSDPQTAAASRAGLHKLGALKGEVKGSSKISSKYPFLREAAEAGRIDEVFNFEGWQANIHKITKNIMEYLEAQGVKIYCHSSVTTVHKNADGEITQMSGTNQQGGFSVEAVNYCIGVGAYDPHGLMHQITGEENAEGLRVAGTGRTYPEKPQGWNLPMKAHKRAEIDENGYLVEACSDLNIAHYDGHGLITSSTYAVVEEDNLLEPEQLKAAHKKHGGADKFLGSNVEGPVTEHQQVCTRSWPVNGGGVVLRCAKTTVKGSSDKGVVTAITANGTGGFTISMLAGLLNNRLMDNASALEIRDGIPSPNLEVTSPPGTLLYLLAEANRGALSAVNNDAAQVRVAALAEQLLGKDLTRKSLAGMGGAVGKLLQKEAEARQRILAGGVTAR